MVLTGDQGAGKTSFIERLALLPEWYCSLNNIKGKDAISNLVGKIIVELEEFVALRNAKSADEAKLFISARTSTVRLPYERFSGDVQSREISCFRKYFERRTSKNCEKGF